MAYVLYAAAMRLFGPSARRTIDDGHPHFGVEDRERVRDGFRSWIAEALRRQPDSIKDL